eukprot:jgi/Astpho2/1893/Aster-x0508
MGEELEQLASQIRAELQAVRKLEEQIDPEEVDGLQTADSHDSGISPASPVELEQQRLALRARKHKKRNHTDSRGFSLQDINQQLAQVLADPSQQRVELGVLKKSQARQVNALAAVYGFESRSCGRKGKTLFKTSDAAPLTQQGQRQVQQLLACSFSAQSEKQEAHIVQQQTQNGAAAIAPLNSSNKGHMLLTKLGWSSGTGLGRKCQGRQDPLLPEKRARRAGLGT